MTDSSLQVWKQTFITGVGKYIHAHWHEFQQSPEVQNLEIHPYGDLLYYKFSVIQIFKISADNLTPVKIFAKAHRNPRFSDLQNSVLAVDAVEKGRQEFEFHRSSYERFAMFDKPFCVVKPLAYVPEYNTILMEQAPGENLGAFISKLSYPADKTDLQNAQLQLRRCGQWLKLLHTKYEHHKSVPFSPEKYIELLDRELNKLNQYKSISNDISLLKEKIVLITQKFGSSPAEMARIHGDYKARHIFINAEQITVIDFGNNLDVLSPFMDVAAFMVEMESLTFAAPGKKKEFWKNKSISFFCEGYGMNADSDWQLRLYMIYYWLKKWFRRRKKFTHNRIIRSAEMGLAQIGVMEQIHHFYSDPWFLEKVNRHIDKLNSYV